MTIKLYTGATPNGYPISVALEELGVPYEVKALNFSTNEQKEDWFLKINPNGRVPAITDENRGGFNVFETSAILLYLAQHYDPEGKISFSYDKEPDLFSEQAQWLMFAHGGIGPMQGQANHFYRYAPEKIPYGINRYQAETNRLFSVLEARLASQGDFLVGHKYSLADIKTFPWVMMGPWAGIPLEPYPHIQAWLERCKSRPATAKGITVPEGFDLEERLRNAKQHEEEARKWIFKK